MWSTFSSPNIKLLDYKMNNKENNLRITTFQSVIKLELRVACERESEIFFISPTKS